MPSRLGMDVAGSRFRIYRHVVPRFTRYVLSSGLIVFDGVLSRLSAESNDLMRASRVIGNLNDARVSHHLC